MFVVLVIIAILLVLILIALVPEIVDLLIGLVGILVGLAVLIVGGGVLIWFAMELTATSPSDDIASERSNCLGASCSIVTPFGWGGIEVGASTADAQEASGITIKDDGHYTDIRDGSCLSYEIVDGPKNVSMLVENGRISTVEVYYDAQQPIFGTKEGVKLGDPEAAVRSAYPDLVELPNIYSDPPDKMLLHYEPGGERGIKFAIVGGIVAAISVGSESIEYVEGCL